MQNLGFLTTYAKDYHQKTIKSIKPRKIMQEFPDTVGQKQLLHLHRTGLEYPDEDGEEFFKRFKTVNNVDSTPLDTEVILEHIKSEVGRTEYEDEYYTKKDGTKIKRIEFPDDMVLFTTTQKADFRNPVYYNPEALKKTEIVVPQDGTNNKKLNEIMQVRTGISEYTRKIGNLGETFLQRNFERRQPKK